VEQTQARADFHDDEDPEDTLAPVAHAAGGATTRPPAGFVAYKSTTQVRVNPEWRQARDAPPFVVVSGTIQPRFVMQNGTRFHQRTPRVIGSPVSANPTSATSQYAMAALFVPFRDPWRDLLGIETGPQQLTAGQLTEAFTRHQELILHNAGRFAPLEFVRRVQLAVTQLATAALLSNHELQGPFGLPADAIQYEHTAAADDNDSDDLGHLPDSSGPQRNTRMAPELPVGGLLDASQTQPTAQELESLSESQRLAYRVFFEYVQKLRQHDSDMHVFLSSSPLPGMLPPSPPSPPHVALIGEGTTNQPTNQPTTCESSNV
jgi:hypothetical protein